MWAPAKWHGGWGGGGGWSILKPFAAVTAALWIGTVAATMAAGPVGWVIGGVIASVGAILGANMLKK